MWISKKLKTKLNFKKFYFNNSFVLPQKIRPDLFSLFDGIEYKPTTNWTSLNKNVGHAYKKLNFYTIYLVSTYS